MIRRRYTNAKMLLLSVVAVYSAFFTSPIFAQTQDLCFEIADPVRVRVGGTEFRIPAIYKLLLDTYPEKLRPCHCRKGKIIINGYCQTKDDPAFKATSISLQETTFRGSNLEPLIDTPYFYFGYIGLAINGEQIGGPIGSYCDRRTKMEARINKWRPFNLSQDFMEADDILSIKMVNGATYYLSKQYKFWGFPVVVKCNREEFNIAPARSGRFCSSIMPLGDKNAVSIRFHDKTLPPDQWVAMFKDVGKFIKETAVTIPAPTPFTSCDLPPAKGE